MPESKFTPAQAEELAAAFRREGVDYLFIGKSGAILLGYPETTQDVDIFLPCSRDNAERVLRALSALGFALDAATTMSILSSSEIIILKGGPFALDLIHAPDGIESFAEAKKRRVMAGIFPVASLDDIIASQARDRARKRSERSAALGAIQKRVHAKTSMTVLEVLQSTTAYFKKRGIDSPRLNAEHLIAHSLGKKRLDIYLEFERDLAEPELAPLRELVRRRAQNEPLQHLLGTVEFCGNVFLCDKRALVPRPETEQLVELVGSKIENRKSKIVDVGTGAGVIALTLAGKFPEAEIVATDISEDALALARENAARLGIDRIQFVQGDLLENTAGNFDAIVANLPYISRQDRDQLAPEVLRDPDVALFAGERGNEIIHRLIEEACSRLRAGGLLALEIGLGQAEALCDLLRVKNYRDIETKNDYAGVTRFLFARHG